MNDRRSSEALIRAGLKSGTKIIYDSKGLIVRSTNATTDDIIQTTNNRYITSGDITKLNNISGINTGDNAVNSLYSSLVGIPIGGTTGQVLSKIDNTDYNIQWVTGSGLGDALTTNPLSQFAATTKAQLNSVISDGVIMFVGDAPTAHTHVIADITDFGIYSTDIHSNIAALNLVSGTNTGDQDLSGLLVKANNLSDLINVGTARTNLGLGTLATQSGTFSGTSSGTNTGDQTSIVGISGTKAQFNIAVSDGDILFTNDITGTPDGTKFLRDDFSWAAVSGGSGTKSINNISTNTSAGNTSGVDYYYLCDGTITLTLPTAVGNTSKYTIKNIGIGVITINTTLSELIDGWDQVTISFKNNSLDIISDGVNYRIT